MPPGSAPAPPGAARSHKTLVCSDRAQQPSVICGYSLTPLFLLDSNVTQEGVLSRKETHQRKAGRVGGSQGRACAVGPQ